MTVLMFANGDIADTAWIKELMEAQLVTAVLAVDGGLRYVEYLGLEPNAIIGDMDSVLRRQENNHHLAFPRDKDETDLELALLHAIKRYPSTPIWLFATLGGRLDHMLANITLLAHPLLQGKPIRIIERFQQAWLMTAREQPHIVEGEVGDIVSLLPLGGSAHVRQTVGLKWELQESMLEFGPARGVSNELTAVRATIQLQQGTLLCVHTQKGWKR